MDELKITFAKEDNYLDIVKLYKQLWEDWKDEDDITREMFLEDLKTSRKEYLIGKIDNVVVGVCSLFFSYDWHRKNMVEIQELVVDKEYRGKGIGKKLVDRAYEIAKEKGCTCITLHSNMKRVDAHRFYKENGFEQTSYYFKKWVKEQL